MEAERGLSPGACLSLQFPLLRQRVGLDELQGPYGPKMLLFVKISQEVLGHHSPKAGQHGAAGGSRTGRPKPGLGLTSLMHVTGLIRFSEPNKMISLHFGPNITFYDHMVATISWWVKNPLDGEAGKHRIWVPVVLLGG